MAIFAGAGLTSESKKQLKLQRNPTKRPNMTLIKTKYNRRSFLKVSSAAGGGMMIGFSWLASCTSPGEKMLTMPDSWFDINAFIKIGENGVVTIFSPNPEIGQNVKTSMPMIVAEELDVDWKKVIVEQAGLNTDKYSGQMAGGSNSIRGSWNSLRMAGATAKNMFRRIGHSRTFTLLKEADSNGLQRHSV